MPLDLPLYSDIKALHDATQVKLDAGLQRVDQVLAQNSLLQQQLILVLAREAESSTALAALSNAVLLKLENLMTAMTDLQAAVAVENTVIDSAVVLLNGLKASLDAIIAAGATPEALAALSADIGAKTQALADAVAANTPTVPVP